VTPTEGELRDLVAELAELEPDEIDLDTPFPDAGIDSLLAMEIAVHVEARFGVRFEDADVREAQTVRALAALVGERVGG
jgi:acyl carrier protein